MKTWYSKQIKVELVDDIKIGKALRKLRELSCITMRQMAIKLRISASYLSDLENGNRHWDKPRHDRFVKYCGTS